LVVCEAVGLVELPGTWYNGVFTEPGFWDATGEGTTATICVMTFVDEIAGEFAPIGVSGVVTGWTVVVAGTSNVVVYGPAGQFSTVAGHLVSVTTRVE